MDHLSKIRDSNLFFIKVDFGVLVVLATAITFFDVRSFELLVKLADYKIQLTFLGYLIMYGFLLEMAITYLLGGGRFSKFLSLESQVSIMRWALLLQGILHIFLLWMVVVYGNGFFSAVKDMQNGKIT